MNILRKALRKLIHILGGHRIIPPLTTMRWLHKAELGRFPDLQNPKDFNERLMWMEFNSDTTLWSLLADKHEVREYVKQKGLKGNLIPLYGIYNAPEEIDFKKLPESFVIKSTNGCGQTIIVNDKTKLNIQDTIAQIKNWEKNKIGYITGEKHYLSIPFRIQIEALLPMNDDKLPMDYKFYCFNGEVKYCLLVTQREIKSKTYKLNIYRLPEWEEEEVILQNYKGKGNLWPAPGQLKEMMEIASKLSKGFPFVRVDLYNINGKIYFGEMTFTPAACRQRRVSHDFLLRLGSLIKFAP